MIRIHPCPPFKPDDVSHLSHSNSVYQWFISGLLSLLHSSQQSWRLQCVAMVFAKSTCGMLPVLFRHASHWGCRVHPARITPVRTSTGDSSGKPGVRTLHRADILKLWMLQVPSESLQELRLQIENLLRYSSQSTMPSIYGIVAAAEVKRLRQPEQTLSLVSSRTNTWAASPFQESV